MKSLSARVLASFCLSLPMALFAQSNPSQHVTDHPAPETDSPQILQDYDRAIDQIAEKAMRSVVEIDVTSISVPEKDSKDSQTLQRQRALGSGVIVSPDGYIMTNNHVIAGALHIRVVLSPTTAAFIPGHTTLSHRQRVYEAKLIGANRYSDLALIKIEEKDLPFISLPPPFDYKVRLGQTVLAIGSPEGLDHTVTKGIVSAVGRQPELDRPMIYVQTDAPINPGNSGGPLIDRHGNLIGINTFIYTSGGGSEGLGFAIPEPIVWFAYEQLKEHGVVVPITIGVHAQTITPPLAAGLKLPQDYGVIISDVDIDGPGMTGGLKPGDIITELDGFPIDSLPKYTGFLYMHQSGHPMEMKVLRGDKTVTVSVTPAVAPPNMDNLSDLINPQADLIAPLGVFVMDLKGNLSQAMGTRAQSGVIVAGLLGEEPVTLADLQVGDVVMSLNGKPVTSTVEFRSDLASHKPGDAVVLKVERRGVNQYIAFEIE
jgi:serine protease Do